MLFINSESREWFNPVNLVAIFLSLSLIDIALGAAAGVAAAATGAHVNGDPITNRILTLGAIGGVVKSAVLCVAGLLSLTSANIYVSVLVIFVASSFGAAILTTTIIAGYALGRVPDQLLIAAVAAGAPLISGMAASNASTTLSALGIGFDALGGYTFSRVAENHSFHICNHDAAAAAGAVFGSVVYIGRMPLRFYLKKRQFERVLAEMER
ncbi:hypothetical protein BJX61DRAFT_547069 [Aspergillus egyptiacus]|nr:hypothetical protein BJX61DRAFT_547069 [Aspergillus egyptiacus]